MVIYIYQNENGLWEQDDFINVPDSTLYDFGTYFYVKGDILLVRSVPIDSDDTNSCISVYRRSDDSWVEELRIFKAEQSFGVDLEVISNTIVLIGTLGTNNSAGIVEIYEFVDGEWIETSGQVFFCV